jgi:predicted glycosyltransferase
MRVWYDACTGKHIRYGVAVAKKFRSLGHEVVLTTRKHPDTLALAEMLNEKVTVVGKYAPNSSYTRLLESIKRQLTLSKMFGKNPPDIAISHGSVELCRVAFGLNIPTISTADSPHATAANKLALPLVNAIIISKAMPLKYYKQYGAQKIIQFDGVDETAWIKDYKPIQYDYEKPLIVVRQMETKASYAEKHIDITEEIAKKLTALGHVLFLPRYDRRPRKNLIVPKKPVDSTSLAAYADLVVSVGGTLAREAALQGTPSIVISVLGKLYANEYISKKGFPLFTVKPTEALTYAEKYLGKKFDVKEKLEELENPVDVIVETAEKLKET